MGKANKSKLEELHKKVTEYYLDVIDEGEELSSGTLNAINNFLKTNGIVAEEVDISPAQNLQNKLQSFIKDTQGEI